MRYLNIFYIDKIIRDAGFGSSAPIIVSANNKEYVLKTKEDGMQHNSLGLFNELLAYQILSVLNYKICPQQVDYLYIDENFIEMAEIAFNEGYIKEESYENIKNSEAKFSRCNATLSGRYILKEVENILDTSFQLIHSGSEESEDLIQKLFYDYIGYKFDTEEKISKLSKIIDDTKNLVKKEFKGFLNVPINIDKSQYDFLNTRVNITDNGISNRIKLSQLNVKVHSYYDEEQIANYCKNLI